jgi:hypothetical protein
MSALTLFVPLTSCGRVNPAVRVKRLSVMDHHFHAEECTGRRGQPVPAPPVVDRLIRSLT